MNLADIVLHVVSITVIALSTIPRLQIPTLHDKSPAMFTRMICMPVSTALVFSNQARLPAFFTPIPASFQGETEGRKEFAACHISIVMSQSLDIACDSSRHRKSKAEQNHLWRSRKL
jgi:hypothetical protein